MDNFVAKRRYLAFVAHSDYFVHRKQCHRLVSHIIDYQLTHLSMDFSHQPGESGGGPGYGQLRDLTLLDDLHHSIDRGSTQDDLEVFQPWVLHYYGYLVFILPLNAGYLNIHHNEPFGFNHDTPDAGYWRNLPSYFLSQAIQGHNIHAPFTGVGGSDEIDLCSIIQETGCQLPVN